MAQREPGECMGGGGIPMRRTSQRESDGSITGECAGCGERLKLDHNGLIPRHQRPERFEGPSAA